MFRHTNLVFKWRFLLEAAGFFGRTMRLISLKSSVGQRDAIGDVMGSGSPPLGTNWHRFSWGFWTTHDFSTGFFSGCFDGDFFTNRKVSPQDTAYLPVLRTGIFFLQLWWFLSDFFLWIFWANFDRNVSWDIYWYAWILVGHHTWFMLSKNGRYPPKMVYLIRRMKTNIGTWEYPIP